MVISCETVSFLTVPGFVRTKISEVMYIFLSPLTSLYLRRVSIYKLASRISQLSGKQDVSILQITNIWLPSLLVGLNAKK